MSTRSSGTPRLSVITPLFNCLHHTRAMVESLQASLPRSGRYEIILVDDGSTDGTREWLSGLREPFRVVLNERNMGFGASSNRGAALARAKVLVFLNNDLVLKPGWLSPMLWALRLLGKRSGLVGNVQIDATTGAVDHAGIFVNLKGKPEHIRSAPGFVSRTLLPIRPVFAVTGACFVVRARVWRHLRGFDEAYINGCEDVDLCIRARRAGLINAVALPSRVLHHVSASPGRKKRDEENTLRLVRHWRDELAWFGSRGWTRLHFDGILPEPREFPDTGEALWMAAYLLHLKATPPPIAIAAMNGAIDLELARWQKMFSS